MKLDITMELGVGSPGNFASCLICCNRIPPDKLNTTDPDTNDGSDHCQSLLQVLEKYLEWDHSDCPSSKLETLFCEVCKSSVTTLLNADLQLSDLMGQIQRITTDINAKIVESHKGQQQHSTSSIVVGFPALKKSRRDDDVVETEIVPPKEFEEVDRHLEEVEFYRSQTIRRFDPTVPCLQPLDDLQDSCSEAESLHDPEVKVELLEPKLETSGVDDVFMSDFSPAAMPYSPAVPTEYDEQEEDMNYLMDHNSSSGFNLTSDEEGADPDETSNSNEWITPFEPEAETALTSDDEYDPKSETRRITTRRTCGGVTNPIQPGSTPKIQIPRLPRRSPPGGYKRRKKPDTSTRPLFYSNSAQKHEWKRNAVITPLGNNQFQFDKYVFEKVGSRYKCLICSRTYPIRNYVLIHIYKYHITRGSEAPLEPNKGRKRKLSVDSGENPGEEQEQTDASNNQELKPITSMGSGGRKKCNIGKGRGSNRPLFYSTGKKRDEWKQSVVILPLGNNQFQFGNYIFEKVEDGRFKCVPCSRSYPHRNYVLTHIQRCHIEKEAKPGPSPSTSGSNNSKGRLFTVKLGENLFQYMLYKYEFTPEGEFKCHTCSSAFSKRQFITDHIRNVHACPPKPPEEKPKVRGKKKLPRNYNSNRPLFYSTSKNKEEWKKNVVITPLENNVFEYEKHVFETVSNGVKCHTCDRVFTSRPDVLSHIHRMHIVGSKRRRFYAPRRPKTEEQDIPLSTMEGNKFEYGTYTFELTPDGVFKCHSCPETCDDRELMLNHIRKEHISEPSQTSVEKFEEEGDDDASCSKSVEQRGFGLKVQNIGENRFQYGHYTFEAIQGVGFKCDSCGKVYSIKNVLVTHIRRSHIIGGKRQFPELVQVSETQFCCANRYLVKRMDDQYHCLEPECAFSHGDKVQIRAHIYDKHYVINKAFEQLGL